MSAVTKQAAISTMTDRRGNQVDAFEFNESGIIVRVRLADEKDRPHANPKGWVEVELTRLGWKGDAVSKPVHQIFVGQWPVGCAFWTMFGICPEARDGIMPSFWNRRLIDLVDEGTRAIMRAYSRRQG
jgi:hypothetical protein